MIDSAKVVSRICLRHVQNKAVDDYAAGEAGKHDAAHNEDDARDAVLGQQPAEDV